MQVLPSEEGIVKRTPSALEVLNTRGRARRLGSQAAVANAAASSAVSGADTGAATAGNGSGNAAAASLIPQVGTLHRQFYSCLLPFRM